MKETAELCFLKFLKLDPFWRIRLSRTSALDPLQEIQVGTFSTAILSDV